METLLALVQERNARETTPFVEIHAAHQRLWHQVEVLQTTCDSLERQLVLAREQGNDRFNEKDPHRSESAALRNERKLKEWVERLEERIQKQTAQQEQDTQKLQEIAKERDTLQSLQSAQETTMIKLQEENEQQNRAIEHLTTQTNDSQQRAKLAEQQYVGLKDAIRVLQEENDSLKKENRELETRLVSEKERLSAEMNTLTDLVERQKRQAEMAQTYQQQEEKRKSKSSWFGLSSSSNTAEKVILPSTNSAAADPNAAVSPTSSAQKIASPKKNKPDEEVKRPPPVSAKVPIKLKHLIQAHYKEASCVRYDDLGSDTLVTGGSVDGTVKVWNTANGSAKTSFKGGSHNAIIAVDSTNHLVAGGGTDKTVRVWNHTTNRMVHHLVGHSNKITSLRFFGGERGIVTAASDRQIKVWDISRQTYRQTATMHLNSTANSIDTTFDSRSLGSGHTDGSLQFWDMQTGQKSAEFKQIHESAITSVQFHPVESTKLLTNGMDSRLKLVDVRTGQASQTFHHQDFQTSYNWSSASFSPDGEYVASGSSSNGIIFIWSVKNGRLVRKLQEGHEFGVCGFAWGRGGTSGQQVASVDKMGKLVLWE